MNFVFARGFQFEWTSVIEPRPSTACVELPIKTFEICRGVNGFEVG